MQRPPIVAPLRRAARRGRGGGLVLYDDGSLCTQAGFCKNRQTDVWVLVDDADDEDACGQFVTMVHHCPSGRLAYAESVDPGTTVEPVFEASIGVEPNASYWVRGGIPVVAEDGAPYEVRNRQTLCRCGHSQNKPFCDGSHGPARFTDPAQPS